MSGDIENRDKPYVIEGRKILAEQGYGLSQYWCPACGCLMTEKKWFCEPTPYGIVWSLQDGKCFLCEKRPATERAHLTYQPAVMLKVCHDCHFQMSQEQFLTVLKVMHLQSWIQTSRYFREKRREGQ